MNKLLLLVACCMWSCFAVAKDDLSKQEKAIVKTLKKQYKLESVDVKRTYDGCTYYRLLTKDSKYMIANANGDVIIPSSKLASDADAQSVDFFAKHEKGWARHIKEGLQRETVMSYHPGNTDVFITQKNIGGGANKYDFYGFDGTLLATFDGTIRKASSASVYISRDLIGQFGLLSIDGIEILPTEYEEINVNSNGICYLAQNKEGIKRQGGTCISELTDITVPCIFYSVAFSNTSKNWLVQVHEYDSIVTFAPTIEYNTSYLDRGQMLFEQGNYEDARKYYTINGDTAKWADFFVGAIHYKNAEELRSNMLYNLSELENSSQESDRELATKVKLDFDRFLTDAENAERFLRFYQEKDTRYLAKSKEMLYELSEMRIKTKDIERRLSMALMDFDRRCAEIARQKQEEYNRQMKQKQLQLEQQKLREQRLVREQREREIRIKQLEKKKAEEKRKNQQKKQSSRAQSSQQPQRMTKEQLEKAKKGYQEIPVVPKKKNDDKDNPKQ